MLCWFFFFKQKTAYEMRISDWSSDVCSSDLFHLNFEVGRDSTLEELRNRHDALLIATGVYKSRDMAVPGVGNNGVVKALDYLIASNRKGFGDAVPAFEDGTLDAEGKNVVVIGGGDTAMRSEEHTSELQSLMRISYAVFCLKK